MEQTTNDSSADSGQSLLTDGLAVFPVPAFLRQSARKRDASKMFAVVFRLQEPEITARCYGKECGRGIFAALFDDDLGALVPCAQEVCPFLDKQTDEPLWEDGEGRDVYLRRLTPLTANV